MSPLQSAEETRATVAHLARRAGFGLGAAQVDELAADGYPAAVERLVAGLTRADAKADAVSPPAFDTAQLLAAQSTNDPAEREAAAASKREQSRALVRWWLERMVVADEAWHEKLTFLWHDHFATSLRKIQLPELMWRQYQTIHQMGPGRFDLLLHALSRDAAMLVWLDGNQNRRGAPNENFARELMELFALGHGSADGHEDHPASAARVPYTEADVDAAARALTGWRIDRETGEGVLVAARHDDSTKTILGTSGRLGLDEVVQIVTAHPACAPHVVAQLWSRLAHPVAVDDPVVVELAGEFARDMDVANLLRNLYLHPRFISPDSQSGLVKTPVEWLVGTLRALELPLPEGAERLLVSLGQVPFAPPDVAGWPANTAWLSTASAQARLAAAAEVGRRAPLGWLDELEPAGRPRALARTLGVGEWRPRTAAALTRASTEPATLVTLALVSPEYLVS